MPREQSFKCLIYVSLSSETQAIFPGFSGIKDALSLSSNIDPVAGNALELNVVNR